MWLIIYSSTLGDIEDFPGLSSLARFPIIEQNGNIYLSATNEDLSLCKRERYNGKREITDTETVVVVGGGGAGHNAIETFR